MRLLVIILSSLCICACANAQSPAYPKNYFRWPLDLEPQIVANMGELRPNHWHMGLDMRTNQKENQLVYAAAEGYISYIGIRPQSFGRFIIINHPNGLSTLYAHLNDFAPHIEKFVTEYQYSERSWATELTLKPTQLPVSSGAHIAYSGNTGGSQGPHVHFEIRDTRSGKCLNPLLFGFPLADDVAPVFEKLALYDRTQSIYDARPTTFATVKTDSGYTVGKRPVLKTNLTKLSFGIQAFDRMNGSANRDGIYSAQLFVDGERISAFTIDSISYDETAYMNAHIDFSGRARGGSYVQHLTRMPGDRSGIYTRGNDGVIELNDTIARQIRIEIKDAAQNISTLNFILQRDSLAATSSSKSSANSFAPAKPGIFKTSDFELKISDHAIYDTVNNLYVRGSGAANAISHSHQLNSTDIPVHDNVEVKLRLNRTLSAAEQQRIIIQRSSRSGRNNRLGRYENGWAIGSFGDFGAYQAFVDFTPPTIKAPGKGDTINLSATSRIVFTPSDNFGIAAFSAKLNGEWLRFTNDKGRSWIYTFDERCPYGVHNLEVRVTDIGGNEVTGNWWFKRNPYTPPPPKKKAVSKKKKKKTTVTKKKKR